MTTTPEQAPDEVATVDERGGNDADREAALAVRNLTKTFEDGDESVQAVDDVSLAIRPGTVVGVLGPNGAGKTTLIKSILGLVIADEGDVSVAGTDVYADPRAATPESARCWRARATSAGSSRSRRISSSSRQ